MDFSPWDVILGKISQRIRNELMFRMSIKRVILANGSRLLREMLHRVINQADQLEVIEEIPTWEALSSALERFDPEWVILAQSEDNPSGHQLDFCMKCFPSVRFVFISPEQNNIKMRWQVSHEAEYPDLSLKEFIRMLEKDY